jgi:hypothetical protein
MNRLRNTLGKHVHRLVVKGDTIRGTTSNKSLKTYYLIGIIGYLPGNIHTKHAISAVRQKDKLFVFDPHGHSRQKITNMVAYRLGRKLKVKRVVIYNGEHLQARNVGGACVGFSSDFLAHVRSGKLKLNSSSINTNISSVFRRNANDPTIMHRSLIRYETPGPQSSFPRNT